MNEKTEGGAGPALAGHSKGGSAPGLTSERRPAVSKNDQEGVGESRISEAASALSGQARNAASAAASSVSEAAESASHYLSGHGSRMADQAAEFVREQPIAALLATGMVCLVLGLLLGRR